MERIIKWSNDYPLVVVILITILVFCIVQLYININKKNTPREYFEDLDKEFSNKYVGNTKLVNFRCKHNGKEYYLACVRVANCTPVEGEPDCETSAIVLIDRADLDANVSEYLLDLNDDEAICEYRKTLCSKRHEGKSDDKIKELCRVGIDDCKKKRMYVHDFVVTEIAVPISQQGEIANPRKKYVVSGTSDPLMNGRSFGTMLNQHLYNRLGYNLLCGDTFPMRAENGKNDMNGEVLVIEQSKDKTNENIIGGIESNIRVLLRFNTHMSVIGTDKNTGKRVVTHLFDQPGDKPKVFPSYVGISKTRTCTYNNKSYPRVCLYDNPDNNEDVLYFEPILIAT